MRTTNELYGINPLDLADMPYRLALVACKEGAKHRLWELMQYGFMDRDEALIIDINKALEWCKAKLEEIK